MNLDCAVTSYVATFLLFHQTRKRESERWPMNSLFYSSFVYNYELDQRNNAIFVTPFLNSLCEDTKQVYYATSWTLNPTTESKLQ